MKKLILFIIFLFWCNLSYAQITTAAYVTADDVTVLQLEQNRLILTNAINSADGSLLQSASITSAALNDNANPVKRWDEAFNDFVFTGLVPPTSGTLNATTTAGTAYIEGVRVVKDATAKTYTASKHTYVDISKTGTYTYSEVNINANEPSVAANSIRIARVSTDGTTVLSVVDRRITQIAAGRFLVSTFTRDLAIPSGTQEITGVGFKPEAVVILGGLDSPATLWSIAIGTAGVDITGSISSDHEDTADTIRMAGNFMIFDFSGTNQYVGALTSFDNDGFTITWAKTGNTSGTGSFYYLVFK